MDASGHLTGHPEIVDESNLKLHFRARLEGARDRAEISRIERPGEKLGSQGDTQVAQRRAAAGEWFQVMPISSKDGAEMAVKVLSSRLEN